MCRQLIIGLFAFVCFQDAKAQSNSSLLWEISGNGLKQNSYIYGTIHLIGKSDFVVRPEIDSVFNLSEQVVFEMKLDDPDLLTIYQDWMYLPVGSTLKDYCTPEEYQKLKRYLADSLNTEIESMTNQKPFAISQLLIDAYFEEELASFELYFMTKCLQQGKNMKGLEKIQDQLHIYDSIPFSEQIDDILKEIDSETNNDILMKEMINAYKKEDLEALRTFVFANSPEVNKYEDLYLNNRNENWITEIRDLMVKSSAFIAVGAAHLPGEKGILQLLKEQGYTVTSL